MKARFEPLLLDRQRGAVWPMTAMAKLESYRPDKAHNLLNPFAKMGLLEEQAWLGLVGYGKPNLSMKVHPLHCCQTLPLILCSFYLSFCLVVLLSRKCFSFVHFYFFIFLIKKLRVNLGQKKHASGLCLEL